ncbi:peroxiredoxin 5, partial [Basidiobolus meristosporus CBS 931.73]
IKVGQQIPNIALQEAAPYNEVNAFDALKLYEKALVLGSPGAFNPIDSRAQIPSYLDHMHDLASCGVDMLVFVSVNDAFVTKAWEESFNVDSSKVRFLADPKGEFVRSIGLQEHCSLNTQPSARRFAMILERGKVKQLFVEPENGLSCSYAPSIVHHL